MKYCINCGKRITEGTKFCPYCGAKQNSIHNTSSFKRNIVPKIHYWVITIDVLTLLFSFFMVVNVASKSAIQVLFLEEKLFLPTLILVLIGMITNVIALIKDFRLKAPKSYNIMSIISLVAILYACVRMMPGINTGIFPIPVGILYILSVLLCLYSLIKYFFTLKRNRK